MNINPIKPVNFTYQPDNVAKEKSLGTKIMGPLRKAIGSSIGKELGKIRLSKSEKVAFKNDKDSLIENGKGKSLAISMQNRKGNETHKLDGFLIKNPNASTADAKEKKYILVFYGMGDGYEKHLKSMEKLAEDTNATVVSFNYRGKGESTGAANSVEDYVMDGKAFVEYLKKEEGANPENILLYGHSLGGGVAAKVCEEINHKGAIILDSSFSTFKKASTYKKGAFTSWVMKKTGWAINNVKALENVDENKLGIIVNRRDPTVHYEKAAFYKGLKSKEVDKEVTTIKIGREPSKERLDEQSVKVGKKSFKKNNANKEAVTKDNDPAYQNLQKNIKKEGWMRFVRHPHQMIIDQQKDQDKISMPEELRAELDQLKTKAGDNPKLKAKYTEKQRLANELVALNKKYAQEDQLAYDGMVEMIGGLFNAQNKRASQSFEDI